MELDLEPKIVIFTSRPEGTTSLRLEPILADEEKLWNLSPQKKPFPLVTYSLTNELLIHGRLKAFALAGKALV